MKRKTYWVALSALGWLAACEQERTAPPAYHPASARPAVAAHPPISQADAERLGRHLTQRLGLSPTQEKQISQLTLGQAREEQRLWARLSDTARQQLRGIARRYDDQLKAVLTVKQYRQFGRLRQTQRQRGRATAEATQQ